MYHRPHFLSDLGEIRALEQMAVQINATFHPGGNADLVNQDPERIRQGNGSECVITQPIRTLTVVSIN